MTEKIDNMISQHLKNIHLRPHTDEWFCNQARKIQQTDNINPNDCKKIVKKEIYEGEIKAKNDNVGQLKNDLLGGGCFNLFA